jgi:hypothetical protein
VGRKWYHSTDLVSVKKFRIFVNLYIIGHDWEKGHPLQETQCSGSGITYPDTASLENSGAYSDQRQSVSKLLKLIQAKSRLKREVTQIFFVSTGTYQTRRFLKKFSKKFATGSRGFKVFQTMRILSTAIL